VSRRLSILASVILLLFVLIAAQSAWVQFFHAPALDASTQNPRNNSSNSVRYQRGEILAADGTVLAQSVATSSKANPWRRIYPQGALTAGVVGFTSSNQGNWALEAQYNDELEAHSQPAESFEQVLAPTEAADSVTLTLNLELQKIARAALAGRDGSVVAIVPSTGNVLAMYSNPTFNPVPFTSFNPKVQAAAWKAVNTKDKEGFPPLGLLATQQTFFPGSTFKVITTAGIVAYQAIADDQVLPANRLHQTLPDTTSKLLYNDGDVSLCGGTVAQMLPQSCDPGYATCLGLALGAQDLTAEANAFGYNEMPPLDLPGVVPSFFPAESNLAANPPFWPTRLLVKRT
jgi:peptidoglycan glycosyltransferase